MKSRSNWFNDYGDHLRYRKECEEMNGTCPKCGSSKVSTPLYLEDGASVYEYECLDCQYKENKYIGNTNWIHNKKDSLLEHNQFNKRWGK